MSLVRDWLFFAALYGAGFASGVFVMICCNVQTAKTGRPEC